jgi:uncharacterized protein YjbI with pentapeptide repeats
VANEEHVKRLHEGVAEWNAWREKTALGELDLSHAKLSGADLTGADLSGAIMIMANLTGASVIMANLRGANLVCANLIRANVSGANVSRANLEEANLSGANVTGAHLSGANLSFAHLRGANLSGADLSGADLSGANLSGANLSGANLSGAHLTHARLTDADLSGANLIGATLSHADLTGANLTGAELFNTVFGDVDLTSVIGLETCEHMGPSIIDHKTLQKSRPLPLSFLRGVGLPDNLIDYLPSLLNQPIQFYSCFISYSSKDQDFADRIHADLQNKGVRCWFAPHDMPIGGKILDEIDTAIRLRDKVLLILSEHSIKSDWVEDEVSKAFAEERKRGQTLLFPVRLDDAVMDTREAWAVKLRDQRNIGDFRRWKDHDGYTRSFERVLRDLKLATEAGK